jgi:hypothetical protein
MRVIELEIDSGAANRELDLYRGMAGMSLDDAFLTEGGTELAPMSTTASLEGLVLASLAALAPALAPALASALGLTSRCLVTKLSLASAVLAPATEQP